MRAVLLALALSSTSAAAEEEKRGDGDLCCILCGGWAALLALTCPPCTACASPLFWIVGQTGGECFKGTGDCDDLAAGSADACTDCLFPPRAAPTTEEPPKPEPPPPVAPEDEGTLQAMSY